MRDRIAAAIGGVDDWRGVTDPAILADAVIAALDERGWLIDPESGERRRRIRSAEKLGLTGTGE